MLEFKRAGLRGSVMWRAFCALALLALGWVGSAWAGESLYRTTSSYLGNRYDTADDSYVFIAPYFTEVQTMLSVSITKAAASGSATAKSPSILNASWQKAGGGGKITYSVSCDLTSVVLKSTTITVTNARPDGFNVKDANVEDVTQNTIVVDVSTATSPGSYSSRSATISGVSCPVPDTFSVMFTVTPIGKSRGYLYLRRNAFFTDAVNVSVGSDGLLSSSDSSSVQQITAILNELAQTVAPFVSLERAEGISPADARQKCYSIIADLVRSVPYYNAKLLQPGEQGWTAFSQTDPASNETVSLNLGLNALVRPARRERIGSSHDGLVAFFPVPASATVYCAVTKVGDKGPGAVVPLTTPTILSLYTERHILDPQRDFFTNPQDTFTFNAGIITGHKFTEQSPAKTIVDTLTGPIRAMMPSVTVTQSTQVQSVGGKPTQTTQTTSTQTAPPKGP